MLLGRLSRGFFCHLRASNFKHFKQLFMTLSGLGSLTMWELPRWVSYFVSSLLWNYFSCFLQDFWSSPSFLLPSIASFLHDHFTTQFQFLAVSILADKPVNRSIHAYALEHFCVKGFIFFDIHRKQGRSSSNSGDKIQKKRLENILAHAHLWRGSTQIEYSSQKMAQQVRK